MTRFEDLDPATQKAVRRQLAGAKTRREKPRTSQQAVRRDGPVTVLACHTCGTAYRSDAAATKHATDKPGHVRWDLQIKQEKGEQQ